MFHHLHKLSSPVTIFVDNRSRSVAEGETVAAALLTAGFTAFCSSSRDGRELGPYCMVGNCYSCLVEIDGMPYRQACLTQVAEGMRIRRIIADAV